MPEPRHDYVGRHRAADAPESTIPSEFEEFELLESTKAFRAAFAEANSRRRVA